MVGGGACHTCVGGGEVTVNLRSKLLETKEKPKEVKESLFGWGRCRGGLPSSMAKIWMGFAEGFFRSRVFSETKLVWHFTDSVHPTTLLVH